MSAPSYLVRNRFGVYYFSSRVPGSTKIHRQSTGTRDRREALKFSRKLRLQLEERYVGAEMPKVKDGVLTIDSVDEIENPNVSFEKEPEVSLAKLVTEWLDELILTKSSEREYTQTSSLMLRVFGMLKVENLSQLNVEHIRKLKNTLRKIPVNMTQRYGDLALQAILAKDDEKVISPRTLYKHSGIIKQWMHWCEENDYIDARKYLKVMRTIRKPSGESSRDIFNDEELEIIFTDSSFSKLKNDMQWVMILGLTCGLREGEAIQLTTNDIYKKLGIWVIDVNSKGGKTLKKKTSSGLVPIPAQLLEWGFLDWVENKKKGRLFPDEERDSKNTYSPFSKRYMRYQRRVGVDREGLVFHSFRHLARTKLVDLAVPSNIIDGILRHVHNQSEGDRTYTHTLNLKNKKAAIDKLRFDFVPSINTTSI